MPQTARSYLLDRFRTDAVALRQRADAMAARSAAPVPGPDAVMSRRMAVACERVVAMLDAVSEADDSAQAMATLLALVPLLEQHASNEASAPPVRAVYIGAATRIREVQAAESKATESRTGAGPDGAYVANGMDADIDDDAGSEYLGDNDNDGDGDADADADDVDDDDLHEPLSDDAPGAPDAPPHSPRGSRG